MIFLWDYYGISIGSLWEFYGISMLVLSNFSGITKGCLWYFYQLVTHKAVAEVSKTDYL